MDAFIQSDVLANDKVYTNRFREGKEIEAIAKIERSIDKKLRAALPGLRDEAFGFRMYKTFEVYEYRRNKDIQIMINCKGQ
ncbi:hypothetical protein [Xenorhabdus mauleonii]|uniref:hypothetical protein n=1 Tax=Xenorhabdus mauleonii TaxID=351675 RepID=UPI000B89A5C2|nr:hypothetical protein [Xenorhabdus mauleonii]